MTISASHFAFAGGLLLVLLGIFRLSVLRLLRSGAIKVSATTSETGVTRAHSPEHLAAMNLPKVFLIFCCAAISLIYPAELGGSQLGVAFSACLAGYFALEVWATTRPFFAIDSLLFLLPAICYTAVVALWFVI
jgi:hypothetical protein